MNWRLAEDITFAETESGAVLLDENKGKYWQTNGTGAVVLRALAQGRDIGLIIRELCAAHPGSAHHVEADVHSLVDRAEAAGLVRREP